MPSSSPVSRKPLPNYSRQIEDVSPHISIELDEAFNSNSHTFMESTPSLLQYHDANAQPDTRSIHAITTSNSQHSQLDREMIHAAISSNSTDNFSSMEQSRRKTSNVTIQENELKTLDNGPTRPTPSIHKLTLVSMITLFLAGVVLAIGHHLYYSRMDKSEVGDTQRQQWPLRYFQIYQHFTKTELIFYLALDQHLRFLFTASLRDRLALHTFNGYGGHFDEKLSPLAASMLLFQPQPTS